MEMGLTLSHRLRIEQRLSVEQKIDQKLQIQQSLILALRGEHYKPAAACPKCGKKLSRGEIMRGFRRDPKDYTTRCPRCQHRFTPQLINWGLASRVELPFYCPMQTLDQLPSYENNSPEGVRGRAPAIYHSAIYHFGSLKHAFSKIGVKYRFTESKPQKWEKKVKPFLGRVPDTMIASAAGVTVREIRHLRLDLGIKAYNT